MKKRFLLPGLLMLISISVFTGFFTNPSLKLGVHPWVGYESLYLAREFNWLPSGVELIESDSAIGSLDGLRAGTLDAAALTLDEVFIARSEGIALTVVAVFDVSAGADVLMAKPYIRDLNGLQGARIAVEQSALGALMLAKVLAQAGLTERAVDVVNLPVDEHLAAWQAGAIDASICYQPIASKIKQQGGHRLIDSRNFPDTVFDVLAVRPSVLRHKKLVTDLLSSHFKALQHIKVSRADAVYRIAGRQQVTPQAVNRFFGEVALPSLTGNYQLLANEGSHLHRAASEVNDLMVEKGLLPEPDTLQGLFTARLLPSERGL